MADEQEILENETADEVIEETADEVIEETADEVIENEIVEAEPIDYNPRFDFLVDLISELKSLISALVVSGETPDEATEIEEVSNIQNEYLDDKALADALQDD